MMKKITTTILFSLLFFSISFSQKGDFTLGLDYSQNNENYFYGYDVIYYIIMYYVYTQYYQIDPESSQPAITVDATYRVQTRTHLLSHVQGACTHIMCVHAPTDACARIQAVRDKKKYRPIVFYRRGSMRATEPSLTR